MIKTIDHIGIMTNDLQQSVEFYTDVLGFSVSRKIEISEAVCPKIEYGREKIIRVIKDFLGEEYLIQHAQTLKYDVDKANLAKKRKPKSQEKIEAEANSVSPVSSKQSGGQKSTTHFDLLIRLVKKLVERFSLQDVKKALDTVEKVHTGIL
jgi:hypothetical protein